ncbi:hypothetical protein [Thermodesulfovibrio yellowstonii]|uniref:Uncharacterized protein n=1 Tax=Thermodesulfovibrio yellowstonii TaxID=28262 RepID=A0A9W6GE77_9BACT|nr:hypothetical protein [Thermodesulfovibrio islandicus]GLI53663.1 hypothetical protein TISLANDTSLP1_13560 [Thermodesulfovibrio islandicus]
MKNNHEEERMILKHEPIPPYKTVFYIVFLLGSLYLAGIIILGAK